MRELVAASLKHHGRRYIATVVAVVIATAFVAAAMVLGGALYQSIRSEVAGQYNGASAVVRLDGANWEDNTLKDFQPLIDQMDDVSETYAVTHTGFELNSWDPTKSWISAALLGGEHLGNQRLVDGAWPAGHNEALVTEDASERLGFDIGSTIDVVGFDIEEGDEVRSTLTVTGIVASEQQATVVVAGNDLFISEETMDTASPNWVASELLVSTGSSVPSQAQQLELSQQIQALLSDSGSRDLTVQTAYQVVDENLAAINASQGRLTSILLVFPAIAAVVALIVVGTTFQVIFRQREREVALLRVIGATGSQVRSLMRTESAAVGLVGSTLGLAIGVLGGGWVAVATKMVPTFGEGAGSITWVSALILIAVATALTTLAGARPARRASTVSPITALAGNVDTVQEMGRRQKSLGAITGVITLILGTLTVLLTITAPEDDEGTRFLLIVLVAIATAGFLIATLAAALPLITRAAGRLGTSVSFRLAGANTARNPGRTAATGVAVFIGVALISMVTVGAQSLRVTSTQSLDRSSPVDIVVSPTFEPFTNEQLDALQGLEGVKTASVLEGMAATASITPSGGGAWEQGGMALAVPADMDAVHGDFKLPETGQVIVPYLDPEDEQAKVTLCVFEQCAELDAVGVDAALGGENFLLLQETATAAFPGASWHLEQVWLMLDNPEEFATVAANIQDIGTDFDVGGTAATRAAIEQIVNILVMVVVALLAVSVLVALVGIANTLSLSVAERVKENGLLRALGMTKSQVANMLKWESLLIGVVSATLGLAAGAFFGAVGFAALPLGNTSKVIAIPWGQWLLIVLVAVGASLLASILPGRAASRVSPVEALAAE